MEKDIEKYDIFISSKSEDYALADKLYDYLTYNGYHVFFANRELDKIGESLYSLVIDKAIDNSSHMVVISTSIDYINSRWVSYEWRTFCDDLKSGYRDGQIITILSPDINLMNLPASLRHRQSFYLDDYEQKIIGYFREHSGKSSAQPVQPSDDSFSQDKRSLSITGWHESQDDSSSLEDESLFNKATPQLPTIFSRLWLHEFAFESLADRGETVINNGFLSNLVSDCLDLLEFLFLYADHPDLKVHPISLADIQNNSFFEINNQTSSELSKQLLNERDIRTIWGKSPNCPMYIILFKGQVIGGTTPLTLLFTSPQCRSFFQSLSDSFYGEKGQVLFKDTTSFSERGEHFKEYVTGIVAIIDDNKNSFSRYIKSQFDDKLKQFFFDLSVIPQSKLVNQQCAIYEPIILDLEGTQSSIPTSHHLHSVVHVTDKEPIQILFGRIKAEQLISTEFCITPTNPNKTNQGDERQPLVLTEKGDYGLHFLKSRPQNYKVSFAPGISDTPLSNRTLPDTCLKYPYLVADDFFEDHIIALNFKADNERFLLISDNKDFFLPPIKQQFFEYFGIEDLRQQLQYEINIDKGFVDVTLKIPVAGNHEFNSILLRKVYHDKEVIHLADSTRVSIWPNYKKEYHEPTHYSIAVSNQLDYSIHKVCFGNEYGSESELDNCQRHQYGDIHFAEMYNSFDYIRLHIGKATALLVPLFYSIRDKMNPHLSIGIDLGHAYTKIAFCEGYHDRPNILDVRNLHVMNLNSDHDNIPGWKTELTEIRMIKEGNDYVPLPPYLPANNQTILFTDLFSEDTFRDRSRVKAVESFCEQMVQILYNQVVHESFYHYMSYAYHVTFAVPSSYSPRYLDRIRSSWEKAFESYMHFVNFNLINDVISLSILFPISEAIIIDIGKSFTSVAFLRPLPDIPVCSYPIGTSTIWDDSFRNSIGTSYLHNLWNDSYRRKAGHKNIIQEMEMRKYENWMDFLFLEAPEQAQDIQVKIYDNFPDLRALVFTFFAAIIWKVIKNMMRIQATIPNHVLFFGQGIKQLLCFMSDYEITTAVNRLICIFSHQEAMASHINIKYVFPTTEIATCAAYNRENDKYCVQPFINEERVKTVEDIEQTELYNEFISFIQSLRDMKLSDLSFDLNHVCELFEKYANLGITLSMNHHAKSFIMPYPDDTFFWPLEGAIPIILGDILFSKD